MGAQSPFRQGWSEHTAITESAYIHHTKGSRDLNLNATEKAAGFDHRLRYANDQPVRVNSTNKLKHSCTQARACLSLLERQPKPSLA